MVGGVVADEEGVLVPDEARVACIAAGGEREEFVEFVVSKVEFDDGGANFAIVKAHGGDEAAVG